MPNERYESKDPSKNDEDLPRKKAFERKTTIEVKTKDKHKKMGESSP